MSHYYGSSSSANPYQQDAKSFGSDPYNVNMNSSAGSHSNDPYANSMNHNQQWQPSSHANQSHSYNPQQQQQQQQHQQQQNVQGGSTPFWNPTMASTFASVASTAVGSASNPNAMFDLGLKAGHTFLDQGTARMIPGLERVMRELRVYFAVDNSYVKAKMQRVLFSFFYKTWKRIESDDAVSLNPSSTHQSSFATMKKYALPTNDDNALDLYLPTMSLITYVLLCGLCYGTSGQFDPEFLPDVTTRCIVVQIIEVLSFRLGFYLMQVPSSFMDLFAVTGYKYLGLALNMLVGYSLSLMLQNGGHRAYYIMFLWTATAMSYFMLKFMANNIPLVTNATGPKREVVVLAFAGSQFASMWFLGQTRFLN